MIYRKLQLRDRNCMLLFSVILQSFDKYNEFAKLPKNCELVIFPLLELFIAMISVTGDFISLSFSLSSLS